MFNDATLLHRIRPYFTFKYLMLVLVIVFFVRHGMRIDIHVGDAAVEAPVNVSPKAQRNQPEPKPQLASLKHPASRSKQEVAALRKQYIETFAPIAKAEMKAHGIPASITLAQGLLESVAGTSRLATKTNNHFGIKCFKRSCKRGHCHNFEDDHHKDFFRNYTNPEDSYRAHSSFLVKGSRYKKLFKLSPKDYKAWAKGLRKAGYATDPKYAHKLISLIERHELAKYDS
ncbi:MAG: glycoside hydrolase family 73 protein [Saprospiraceae bacterium]